MLKTTVWYLLWLIQKKLDDVVSAFGVVEEDEEGPVNEPSPLLERLERGTDGLERIKTQNTEESETEIFTKYTVQTSSFVLQ